MSLILFDLHDYGQVAISASDVAGVSESSGGNSVIHTHTMGRLTVRGTINRVMDKLNQEGESDG